MKRKLSVILIAAMLLGLVDNFSFLTGIESYTAYAIDGNNLFTGFPASGWTLGNATVATNVYQMEGKSVVKFIANGASITSNNTIPVKAGDVYKVKWYARANVSYMQIKARKDTGKVADFMIMDMNFDKTVNQVIAGYNYLMSTNNEWKELATFYEEPADQAYRAWMFQIQTATGEYDMADFKDRKVDMSAPVFNSSFNVLEFEDWGWRNVNTNVFSYETDPAKTNGGSGKSLTITADPVYDGSSALVPQSIQQNVAVAGGKSYVLSYYVKNSENAGTKVQVLDSTGAVLTTATTNNSNGWTRIVTEPFTISGTAKTYVTVKISSTSTTKGNVQYIDDVRVLSDTSVPAINVDPQGMITVSGKLNGGNENRSINVKILKPGKTYEDLQTSPAGDVVLCSGTTTANSTNNYSITLDGTGTTRVNNTLTAIVENILGYEDTYLYKKFNYQNPTILSKLITSIDDAKNVNEIAAVLSDAENLSQLQLDTFEVKPQNMDFVYESVYRTQTLNTLPLIQDAYKLGCLLEGINETAEPNQVKNWVRDYTQLLALNNMTAYNTTYLSMSDAEKLAVGQKIVDKAGNPKYNNVDAFVSNFCKQSIQQKINTSLTYVTKLNVLMENDIYLGINFTGYNNLGVNGKKDVGVKVAAYAEETDDLSSINNYLKAQVDAVVEEIPNQNSGSGKGGSGSSKGYGAVTVAPLVTATSTPVQIDEGKKGFSDLRGFEWAADSINALSDKQIVKGYEDGTFRPQENVTREEFIKLLISSFGLLDESAACSYEDVKAGEWYAPYIATAQKIGLTSGTGDNTFGVGREISRQEMATLAYRLLQNQNIELSLPAESIGFADQGDIAQYASQAIDTMQKAGIIKGDNGRFEPAQTTTRAQAAVVISRLTNIGNGH